jgi:hydroxymethylglutaryl-CoA lyase
VPGNIATDDLVHLPHREGIAAGIDNPKLAALRDELVLALGHPLDSALAAVPAVPSALRARLSVRR